MQPRHAAGPLPIRTIARFMSAINSHPSRCARCQSLPPAPPAAGLLFLSFPPYAAAAVAGRVRELGADAAERVPGVLAVAFAGDGLPALADGLTALGADLLRDVRSLVAAAGAEPTAFELMGARPLGDLIEELRAGWLVELLRERRVTTFFHPIVPAASPGEVFGYECLLRGLDPAGGVIPAGRLFAAAKTGDLLFHLDRTARQTAIESAARHATPGLLFVNFNPTSIYNPATCLRSTFLTAESVGLPPGRLVFEVVETEEVRDAEHLVRLLAEYRRAGFRVALDDIGAGYSSLNLLARLQPDFVKIDMELIRGVDRDPYKAQVVGKLLEMARGLGVETVVEGVETVGEWEWARDHGADYVQGYLFARPAAEPPVPARPSAGA